MFDLSDAGVANADEEDIAREIKHSERPLIIDQVAFDAISNLAAMASASPIDTKTLYSLSQDKNPDRIFHAVENREILLCDYFTVVYFHQTEKNGTCRHFLISCKDENTIPSKSVVEAIAELLGFSGDVADLASVIPLDDNLLMIGLMQMVDQGFPVTTIH